MNPDRAERRNPRHPQVGRARAPNINNVRSKISTRMSPREERRHRKRQDKGRRQRVQIFNDKEMGRAIRVGY